ncbi:MAG: [Fe-Fe] hydrogenase large subunit C-terminal domain-containing protein [Planctomycetota bacterium]|nr:[Fe-Fe] hydrogenase large subunit C-terminal domain-containing protein [Planctomycetota bacterium]
MPIVSTMPGKCKRCYNCVRNCPVKAIRVRDGQAEVIEERCIACGTCVRVCAQKAKQIESPVPLVQGWLTSEGPLAIACLAPSFPAAFPNVLPGQVIASLRKLGFKQVWEVAFGAQLTAEAYSRLAIQNAGKSVITSPCPAVVSLIEKYFHGLVGYLAPIVSPMTALGRAIKRHYANELRRTGATPDIKVVFIGPCIAKKHEMKDPQVAGVIDAVLTFQELQTMLKDKDIDPRKETESPFDGPRPSIARSFPISGGLLRSAALKADILASDIVVTEGRDRVLDILKEKAGGSIHGKFLDVLFCEGCINGPMIDNDLSVVARKDIITHYVAGADGTEETQGWLRAYADVDLRRSFTAQNVVLSTPTEEQLREILAKVNKVTPEDELNCGSCGYDSCREKAVAVFQGIAEAEMCLPYLVSQTDAIYRELRASHEALNRSHSQSLAQLWDAYRELESTRRQLMQSDKLASLGQLAASVAHEINNPLSVIFTYVKLLKRKLGGPVGEGDKEAFRNYLKTMEQETNRSSAIVRNLLDFARQTEPALEPVDVQAVIKEALHLLQNQLRLSNIRVATSLGGLPQITADAAQLKQAFVNLLLNAIQAMPSGGTLSVSGKWDDSHALLRLRFTDTGIGIPPENVPRLFDPFFTTKERGLGLGLSVVYGIIKRHEGDIQVESNVGQGSAFVVSLPAQPRKDE